MIGSEPFKGWIITEKIGNGAFGKVYKANKGTIVNAIKHIIIPNDVDYEQIKNTLKQDEILSYYKPKILEIENEINILQRLSSNKGIVILHDYDIKNYENRTGWEILIRMEYLIPLAQYIENNYFSAELVVRLGIELCNALESCYNENIIHRDIKETNILVDKHGNFKLCDFGVAKNLEGLTHACTYTGTKGYIAPEMLTNNYDYRVDIYSLGLVLYKLLNENLFPFMKKGSTIYDFELSVAKVLRGDTIPKPCYGSNDLFDVIKKATSHDRDKRYIYYKDMRNDLEKLLGKEEKINIGDLVLFGKYYDEEILWRCIDKNQNGVLLISEYVLCQKAFNSAESGEINKGNDEIEAFGSNEWKQSCISEWLNSTEKKVKYHKQEPTRSAVFYNAYNLENGFLNNFSEFERDKIKYSKIEDSVYKVFLLSEDEYRHYFSEQKDRIRRITNIGKLKGEKEYSGNNIWWYWTRSKWENSKSSLTRVMADGSFVDAKACSGGGGIMPSIYINQDSYVSGDGSEKNPYRLFIEN